MHIGQHIEPKSLWSIFCHFLGAPRRICSFPSASGTTITIESVGPRRMKTPDINISSKSWELTAAKNDHLLELVTQTGEGGLVRILDAPMALPAPGV